jgi:phosphatidylglycerophosphate synthase
MPNKTIPPISELRKICQSDKMLKDSRWWYIWWRKISIYITWVFLHTNITANQVTVLSILLVILGTVLLGFPSPVIALCGVLTYLMYHLMDKVDGEIARYYQKFSITGVYLDELGHNLAFAGIFVGLGLHLAWQSTDGRIYILGAAMVGALFMVMIRYNKSAGFLLFAQYILSQPKLLPEQEKNERPGLFTRQAIHLARRRDSKDTVNGSKTFLVWIRDFVLAVSGFTVMLVFVIAGLVVELYTHRTIFLEVLLKAEALLQAVVLLALVVINIKENVRSECLRLNELAEKRFGN